MTPVVDLPREYRPSTGASTIAVEAVYFESDEDLSPELPLANWPEGIEYERWADVVRPAPRGAFADPLDLADLFGDE
jgi:hypothetical protein